MNNFLQTSSFAVVDPIKIFVDFLQMFTFALASGFTMKTLHRIFHTQKNQYFTVKVEIYRGFYAMRPL